MGSHTLGNILFLDIETVHEYRSLQELDERTQELWSKKAAQIRKRGSEYDLMTDGELYADKAGIYAEFAKIVVISVGMIRKSGEVHLSSYCGDDEKVLLSQFFEMIEKHYCDPQCYLCGHNAKEFDIPFLCRRAVVHGLSLPGIFPTHTDKPWDTKILDTMEMWKFGDRKAYTSLDLLCNILKIPTPKSDIDGSEVSRVYREHNDLERIKDYCERDVEALIEVYKRLC